MAPVVNPWTKKNPLMSMWLSGANAVAGRARSNAAREAKKQQTQLTKEATRFWTSTWLGTTAKTKRRR
jgi:hypothetical protein